ncbi:MAG: hypothetical protein KBC17_01510 [Candidatus Pacebacteria bacterium]|nr:hypothetical protein [Candidatus Paceibacterota bacterium]
MVDYWEYHTLTDTIIAFLTSARSTREFHRILRERGKTRYKAASVNSTLTRLKNKKYIEKTEAGWQLTEIGKKISKRENIFDYIPSPFKNDDIKNCIVSFDIPVKDRIKRDWLRGQLKLFNYVMLQQSLWLGPGPLPKEFSERIKKLGIKDKVKIFVVQK